MSDQSSIEQLFDQANNNEVVQTVKKNNSITVVKGAVFEIVKALEERKVIDDHISDITKSIKDNHQIKPKVMKKLARLVMKKNKPEEDKDQQLVDYLYDEMSK